ncbi:MAG: PolC-type DNA polymerase III [Sedimentisphaeraceae bacterium JB056]
MTKSGVYNHNIEELPIAVIDFETTGMMPGNDRVVEVSVVKVEPGKEPYIAFDTLVNPCRNVGATYIHGIRNSDVEDAPVFEEIAGDFVDSLSGCMVAAYNVYFDIKFLRHELAMAGVDWEVPHFCLMYMRKMLDIGDRCSLDLACQKHNITLENAHTAGADALASAKLMDVYFEQMRQRNIKTYKHLSLLKRYKFIDSFENSPLPTCENFNLKPTGKTLSRMPNLS